MQHQNIRISVIFSSSKESQLVTRRLENSRGLIGNNDDLNGLCVFV